MKHLLTLLVLTVAFAACKKEDKTVTPVAPPKPVAYLDKITSFNAQYSKDIMTDSFAVDENGELKFVAHIGPNAGYEGATNIYTKDAQGRIVKAEGYFGETDMMSGTIYTFEYDGRSNIVKVMLDRISYAPVAITYRYDEYNRVAEQHIVRAQYPAEEIIREYTYAKPGTLNPASMKETSATSKEAKEYMYTYDGKPTPYSTLPKILYYMGIGQLAENNIVNISVRDANNTTTNIYRYDANGLPFNKQSNVGEEYKYYYGER